MDGFRAIAYVRPEAAELVSRRGIAYKSFRELRDSMPQLGCRAVLDEEIVSLDEAGSPRFYDLLRRRGLPAFYAFDILWLDGRDLRDEPLLERKRILNRIAGEHPRILIAQHIAGQGTGLFRAVCENDLEGIVAKWKQGSYGENWFKVLNPDYSQRAGRDELFKARGTAA